MHLRDVLHIQQSVGKEAQKGPDPLISEVRVFRGWFLRSEKLQNESFLNFSNFRPEFCPEFCSEFSPNFSRTFRASFRGRRRPEKIHQKSPPSFNAKFPGKHEKHIHKILLESRQSNGFWAEKPSSTTPERCPESKTPHFDTGQKMGIFGLKASFSGVVGNGF